MPSAPSAPSEPEYPFPQPILATLSIPYPANPSSILQKPRPPRNFPCPRKNLSALSSTAGFPNSGPLRPFANGSEVRSGKARSDSACPSFFTFHFFASCRRKIVQIAPAIFFAFAYRRTPFGEKTADQGAAIPNPYRRTPFGEKTAAIRERQYQTRTAEPRIKNTEQA